jgi:phospholipid/cholesterol/gamma-HCH transport system substrate-binding protein
MTVRGPKVSRRRWYTDLRLVGAAIVVAAAVVMYISYTAQNGLPWASTYSIQVAVPDAGKLIKNTDVKVGGARVGQVLKIQAVPRRGRVPAHAVLDIKLTDDVGPLPADTTAEVRLASVLGGKYVEIVPGHSRRTIPENGRLPLAQASSSVEIEDALSVFDRQGRSSLRRVIGTLADAVAGRGEDLNQTIGTTAVMLPGLERVLATLSATDTRLGGFVRGAAAATTALAPLSDELGPLVANSADTLGALDRAGDSLGRSIEEFPGAAGAARSALGELGPVLDDTAAISRELRPAARTLGPASRRLSATARTAIRVDPKAARLAGPVDQALGAVGVFSRNPASTTSLKLLGSADLATFGSSAFVGLGAILQTSWDAERHCRAASTWIRRLVDISSDGNAGGHWLRMAAVFDLGQMQPQASPSPDLHANPYPNATADECEAGNEGYASGRLIGNPPGIQGGP